MTMKEDEEDDYSDGDEDDGNNKNNENNRDHDLYVFIIIVHSAIKEKNFCCAIHRKS